MPRYYNPSREKFVNPYTFIPVDFGKKEVKDINVAVWRSIRTFNWYDEMHNLMPRHHWLFLIFHSENIENEHPNYRFESTPDGQYMIPASSLRGMIRSVYETATNSCFSTLKENTLLNTRSGNALQAGLLMNENGEWKLYKAKRYMLKIAREDKNGASARNRETESPTLNPEVWSSSCPAYKIRRDTFRYLYALCTKRCLFRRKSSFFAIER